MAEKESSGGKPNDLYRVLLLIILYIFQGIPLSLFTKSIPILFKSYLSYNQVGIIQLCTIPFSIKVIFSPFVEFTYSKRFGKRKTWLVPAQLIASVLYLYLGTYMTALLESESTYIISCLLTFIVFLFAIQDIAVDSWAIEMLHPKNQHLLSPLQTIGMNIGFFIGGSPFMALTSVKDSKEIAGFLGLEAREEAFMSEEWFFKGLACLLMLVTLFVLFCVNEDKINQNAAAESSDTIQVNSVGQVLKIAYHLIVHQRPVFLFLMMCVALKGANGLWGSVGEVYLTSDLGFPRENLNLYRTISFPIQICMSLFMGQIGTTNVFKTVLACLIVYHVHTLLCVYNLLYVFEKRVASLEAGEAIVYSQFDEMKVAFFLITGQILGTGQITCVFAVIFKVCDKRMSALYFSMLATCNNLSLLVPKLYMYQMIEHVGIYYTQLFLTSIAVLFLVFYGKELLSYNESVSESGLREKWWIPDHVLSSTFKTEAADGVSPVASDNGVVKPMSKKSQSPKKRQSPTKSSEFPESDGPASGTRSKTKFKIQ